MTSMCRWCGEPKSHHYGEKLSCFPGDKSQHFEKVDRIEEIEFVPGLAIFAEAGVVDNPETGEAISYIEISNLGHDGETETLRIGLSLRDGVWLGLNVIRHTIRAELPREIFLLTKASAAVRSRRLSR